MDDISKPVLVKGKNGWQGTVVTMNDTSQTEASEALVQLDNGGQLVVPLEILQLQNDGTYYLPFDLAELEKSYGLKDQLAGAELGAAETIVLPVIAEELDIQKRQVATGGVRLHKVVHEREEVVDQPLVEEEVDVERVSVNQVVAQAPAVRYEGDTMIVPVLQEVLVVEKRLLLKEELRITKRQVTVSKPQSVTLRTEEITVEQIAPTSTPSPIPTPAPSETPAPVPNSDGQNHQPTPSGSM